VVALGDAMIETPPTAAPGIVPRLIGAYEAADPLHVEMIEVARSCGVSANYTGSGGAIVAACHDREEQARVRRALSSIDCGVLAPMGEQEG
jgi:hypothetical protein